MSAPAFIWPVYGFATDSTFAGQKRETVAAFFHSRDAEEFAIHPERFNAAKRNLYVGEPRYDRRKRGYRPAQADRDAQYREWLASIDQRKAAA